MTPLKPKDEPTIAPDTKAAFMKAGLPKGNRIVAKTQDQEDATYVKMLGYGNPGVGKTYALAGLLEHGLKIFCISTDIGGSGLSTVRLELLRRGRRDLLGNLVEHEFLDYEQISAFIEDPSLVDVKLLNGSVQNLLAWEPDMIAWEGFSNYQNNLLIDYVLSQAPGTKGASVARLEGLRAELQDWDSIGRGTNSKLNDLLRMSNPVTGKKWHKYMTTHEQEPKENTLTGETTRDPKITGGSRKTFAGAFDIVISMYRDRAQKGEDGKPTYKYRLESDKYMSKLRGFKFEPVIQADMFKFWGDVMRQMRGEV